MLPYLSFRDQFDPTMGIVPYTAQDRLIEVDADYCAEIQLKRDLLARDHHFYYRTQPDTMTAQWEVLALLLEDMVQSRPDQFQLKRQGDQWTWSNTLLNETTTFTLEAPTSLPLEPLDWVGRQVQEDLVLLSADDTARLIGGQLCFPNGWSLNSKWDQPLLAVHRSIPQPVKPSIQVAQRMMTRLRPNRPVWRSSWNFKLLRDLDQSDRESQRVQADYQQRAPALTPENIGSLIWLRIERQSFVKLPRSQQTLFIIHTYQSRLDTEACEPDRARLMLSTLRTTPRALLDYKAVTPIEDILLTYLERASRA
jgi:hypothetical protein